MLRLVADENLGQGVEKPVDGGAACIPAPNHLRLALHHFVGYPGATPPPEPCFFF